MGGKVILDLDSFKPMEGAVDFLAPEWGCEEPRKFWVAFKDRSIRVYRPAPGVASDLGYHSVSSWTTPQGHALQWAPDINGVFWKPLGESKIGVVRCVVFPAITVTAKGQVYAFWPGTRELFWEGRAEVVNEEGPPCG